MFELTIKDQVYQFNFGMGFMREINKSVMIPVENGVKREAGLRYAIAGIIDGEIDTLVDMLELANKGQNPRVTRALLDSYVEDDSTDIDQLFKDVIDFLSSANATKKTTQMILEAVERAK